MFPACSEICPRSSDPAFGANNMPRPAPSTVPVRSPMTKLPPPPPSFSNRSYPSAMTPPVSSSVSLVLGMQHCLHRDAQPANEADHTACLGPHVRAHAIRSVVDAVHRRPNRVIDPVGFLLHFQRDALDVVENRIDPRHRRRQLPRLETLDECHDPAVDHEAADAEPEDYERLDQADGGHDAEQQICGSQFACHWNDLRRVTSARLDSGAWIDWPRPARRSAAS